MRFNTGLFIILLFCLKSYAQFTSPIFENFVDELPSAEVHSMFQDSLGYMWFATDRGIAKYDGYQFTKIETKEYLFTPVVFNFFEESKTKVWINTGRNRLYWFNPIESNPIFHEYEFNDTLESAVNSYKKITFIRKIQFLENGTCLISFMKRSGCLTIYKNGEVKSKGFSDKDFFTSINININKNNFINTSTTNTEVRNDSVFLIQHKYNKTNILDILVSELAPVFAISDSKSSKNGKFILLNNYLIKINSHLIEIYKLPSRGLTIYLDNYRLLIGTIQGVLELDYNLKLQASFLTDNAITSIVKDFEGGYWFSSLQDGIYHAKNVNVKKFLMGKVNPKYLKAKSNHLMICDNIRNRFQVISLKDGTINSLKRVFSVIGGDMISTNNPKIQKYFSDEQRLFLPEIDSTKWFLYFFNNSFDTYSQLNYEIFEKKDKSNYYSILPIKYNSQFNCHDFTIEDNRFLIIATNVGVYKYNCVFDSLVNEPVLNSKNIHFNSIGQYEKQTLLFGKDGLYGYNNDSIFPIYRKNSIKFKKLNGIHIKNDSTAWLYGYEGVFKILYQNNTFQFIQLNQIPKGEIISMTSDDNKLYIGSKNNIYVVDIDGPSEKIRPNPKSFIIDSVQVNSETFLSDSFDLKFGDNLTVFYKLITFEDLKKANFEYSITPGKWLETNKNNLTISAMPYGNFVLRVRSKSHPDIILYQKQLIVPKPLTKKLWFITLLVLLGLTIAYFIIRFYIKFQGRKKEEEVKKLNTELKLLISQMNPHFTFNSIHSIQYYILNNNKDEAIEYLSDFALLMRKTLDFSMSEFITIEEEIQFLKLYITIENKRLEFNYIINFELENKQILSKKMPALLLQPLVENIVQHASYKKNEEQKIIVNIEYSNGFYTIKVIDFGEGTKGKGHLTDHKSYGLSILRNRIKIYNGTDYKENHLYITPTNSVTNLGKTVSIKIKIKEWTSLS